MYNEPTNDKMSSDAKAYMAFSQASFNETNTNQQIITDVGDTKTQQCLPLNSSAYNLCSFPLRNHFIWRITMYTEYKYTYRFQS